MREITDEERNALPGWNKINYLTEVEFRIDKIVPKQEYFWLEVKGETSQKISFSARHVSPDSGVGSVIQQLPVYDYVTVSAVRLEKDKDHMPEWFITAAGNLRHAAGVEKNAFGENLK